MKIITTTVVEVPSIEISAKVYEPTVKMRNYYSSHYLWAAKHFSQQAKIIEDNHTGTSRFDIEHRAYVTNSIFSTVAFLEAAINEIFQDAADNEGAYIKGIVPQTLALMKEYWKLTRQDKSSSSTLLNYQMALSLAQVEIFKEGSSPYQDVNDVIAIRNWLTHYKPQWLGGDDIHYLEKRLENKNISRNPLMSGSGNPEFPDHYLGHGCAEWSVQSAEKFTDAFFKKMGIVPNYQLAKF